MSRPAPDSLWRHTTQEARSWPALEGDVTADVVVIGGGFTGVSAAWHLAARGASVVLLEAATVGFGGSGRNVGLVNAGLWTPPDGVEEKLGAAAGAALNDMLAEGPQLVFDLIEAQQIRCEAVRGGTLHCAHSAAGFRDLQARHAQQEARGAPVKLLDAAETARRTGSPAYHGALWDGRAGTIQPLAYVQGLACAAAARGARVHEISAVTTMSRDGDHWRVTTSGGSVRAARLIQATNAYASDGVPDSPIIPTHFFQLATAPLPAALRADILAGGEGCWDTALIMSSFRLDAAGRLIFGALGNLDGPGGGVHRGWARRKLAALFPQLPRVPFEHEWTGRIAMTSTYLPRVQSLGEGAISIFGYSGRGIAPGTVFGRAAADWAIGAGEFPVPITPPLPEARVALRAAWYETGAVLTHLTGARAPDHTNRNLAK
ncbi:NAD(P)/FAD-dependent oxidoreductase [Flavimaricola marinus]|uniref:Gamma-glutamylputrescine oxidoreductase n=1 Tax=Flavimaricola marinus TaxID=1819565 RepID=A0A238LJU6_9RHOB|nr:FAD-binding oxidoreductase [Flavimaricola marinus]SMY09813.1 Gamma-glutamylputrescine oxidoreductase [Flavimaricola marinus]